MRFSPTKLLSLLFAALVVFLPRVWAEDWQVVWKDDMQTLKVDRDSVRVSGTEIEYWYSDEVDAIVDIMEHRFHAVSDCNHNQLRLIEVYDPETDQTNPVKESVWKGMPYNPDDPVAVMHYEVCRDYGVSG